MNNDNCEVLKVEPLPKVTFTNKGYYPTVDKDNNNNNKHDDDNEYRRNMIVEGIKECGLRSDNPFSYLFSPSSLVVPLQLTH